MTQPPVSPTQADRDTEAAIYCWLSGGGEGCEKNGLLNILARHRLSAIAPGGVDREIEILRRALAWHGDPQRMATTREEWQQTIDAAIVWVKANPEEGRPSFSSYSVTPQAPAGGEAKLREALLKARNQFAFYAREHEAAGKVEKAQTNSRFAKMINEALAEPAPVGDLRAEALEEAARVADVEVTRCLQKVDGRCSNTARAIRDAIRALAQVDGEGSK